MMGDIIETLRHYAYDTEPSLPGFTGKLAIWGERGPVRFIATEDHDGQIELSLSLPGPKRPTEAHCRTFFRALGVEPIGGAVKARGCLHFLMRMGKVN